jgi:hypothetical protein
VTWRDGILLQDGSRTGRVLETIPQWVENGTIEGTYVLPRPIQPGDWFRAWVGFPQGARGRVTFVVAAQGGSLAGTTLLAAVDASGTERTLHRVDLDLSSVTGATNLTLGVLAHGSYVEAWGIWVNPRVEH